MSFTTIDTPANATEAVRTDAAWLDADLCEAAWVYGDVALLWLTLWSTWLRFLAIVPLTAGLALAANPHKPDILIERDGSGFLVRGEGGRLIPAGRPSRFGPSSSSQAHREEISICGEPHG